MELGLAVVLPQLIIFCLDLVVVRDMRRYDNNSPTKKCFFPMAFAAATQQLCAALVAMYDYGLLLIPIAFQYVLYVIMFTATTFVGFEWFMYLRLLLADMKELDWKGRMLLSIPVYISLIMTALSPWTHWVLWFDAAGEYQRGSLFPLQFLGYIYVLFGLAAMVFYRSRGKLPNRGKVFSNFMMLVLPDVVGAVLQLFVFEGGYTMTAVSFTVILMYLSLYLEGIKEHDALRQEKAQHESHSRAVTELNTYLDEALASAKESAEMLARVHEVMGSASWKVEYDETGKEISVIWSDGIRHLFGYDNASEFPNGLDFLMSRVHPRDHGRILDEIYGVINTWDADHVHISSRYRGYRKDGTMRWFYCRGIVKRRADGSPQFAYGIIRDVTKVEEAGIRQQEALEANNAIHDALGSANWEMHFDEQGQMTACIWSDRFRKMLGFQSQTDFPDRLSSWIDRLHPEDRELVENSYWATINDHTGKLVYSLQYRMRTRTDEYRWYSAHGSLTRYPDGTPRIFYGIILDIQEQVLAKQNQETYIARITELNSALEKSESQLKAALESLQQRQ